MLDERIAPGAIQYKISHSFLSEELLKQLKEI